LWERIGHSDGNASKEGGDDDGETHVGEEEVIKWLWCCRYRGRFGWAFIEERTAGLGLSVLVV